ncbi:MAG: zinc-ribbon domain-containing protein [Actinobacteria bacterium]|nr:zinc-ribbon domain-containing protein [Actinomycetota bacterium]
MQQIKAAKEAVQKPRCANCGELVKGAAFCPSCGAPVALPAAAAVAPAPMPAAPAGKVCASCGEPLDDDAVFCGNCGAQVVQAPVQGEGAPPAAEPPPPPVTETTTPPAPLAPAAAEPPAGEAATSQKPGPAQPQESEEAMPPVEETLACPNCNTPIPEKDMRFCPDCGTKVRE